MECASTLTAAMSLAII